MQAKLKISTTRSEVVDGWDLVLSKAGFLPMCWVVVVGSHSDVK